MKKKKNLTGTRQWAVKNVNFISGCLHNCKYCYSKAMQIKYGHKTNENWTVEVVRQKDLSKKHSKYDGIVMFPSSHDITPDNILSSIQVLENLLSKGNTVLIVSKPHLECIKKICYELVQYKPQIQFRFTIGSANSEVLKFWEPNAPSFEERVDCLKYANNEGFSTSVSCEPMLDENIGDVVDIVSPYVTDTIWIGKANQLFSRLNINGITDANSWNEAYKLDKWQSKRTNINVLKLKYANNPMIKFKHGT